MEAVAKRRILFVDDEPLVLKGLQRMLRGMRGEWEMYFIDSARKALTILDKFRFDAVVTDMRMPEMDGAQLLNEVMRAHPDMVRIVLSGEMDQKMILKTVRSSHQYLNKPCEPEVIKLTLKRAFALRSLLSDDQLKKRVAGIDSLPSLPTLYLEIMEELQSPNSSFKKIGAIISRDIGMTAKILQMVNSAYFGLCRKIARAEEAVSYLGMETVKSLVLSAKIFSQFDQHRMAFFPLDELWDHSLRAGMCARAVAGAERFPKETVDGAFMAGILHDLGKLVLAQNLPELYLRVLSESSKGDAPLWEIEEAFIGTTHAQIAAYLMGLWGMPDMIVEAIAFHHHPVLAPGDNDLLTAVHAANALARVNGGDSETEWMRSIDQSYLQQIELQVRLPDWFQACQPVGLEGVEN
jgi:HD-like signal output (HDOD) protein